MAISKVVVVDGNNLIVRIDRGVAGRGVTDVEPIEIDGSLYLVFTFSDGTTETVGPVGTIQYIGQAPIVVSGSTISLSTVPVNLGGTGQTTANAGFNALAPTQTGNSGKYLKTDGTNSAWDLLDISTADITGVLPIANGGTGASTASGARTNLGLGTIATQDASAVAITGGSITGITDLAVADGGTGASTAAGAMVNLLPSYTGNANKRLGLDGTATGLEWVTDGGGTVTSVDVSGGTTGLSFTGGPVTASGTITLSGTLDVDNGGTGATTAAGARTNLNAADQALTLTAGTGLSGGGDLTANRSFSIANTGVTAASYGAASKTLTATVNAQGQLTALADTDIAISNTQISGLGTMSTQNANAVAITGGSITGITDLAVADGGTGASDASGARTNLGAAASAITISAGTGLSGGGDLTANRTLSIANTAVTAASYGSASDTLTATVNAQGQLTALAATPIAIANTQVSGLGTMSTQNSNAVTITGGSITGITDLAIADGGTGASNAADARSNLGLGTAAVLNAGVALGVATLDAGGTVPLSQIPASIQGGVSYQGAWNASTNTPTLVSSVGSKGFYYVVSVAGNTNLNGVTDWLVGDWAIYNGTAWEKIDNTDQVASVNGYTGVVVLSNTDVGAPPTSLTISAGTGLTGGGSLAANRTLSIANTTVTAAPYGTASAVPTFTVNGQGQLTAASDVTIAIANTQVSGLGTMSTQNANSVAITGGSITGITDLAIADGGTGASTAGGALTNLGAIGTITSTDGSIVVTPSGTTVNLAVSEASPASTLLTQVRNTTGATLTKGTVVYISGATGQIATVSKAIATGDSTSAQTLGMITSNLANNTNGYVTVFGLLENMDTSAYTDGAQLYLSGTVAGAVTATKPSAPIHLVYVAVVEYAHPTQGKLLVKVQNGYELDEIHDVSIVTPVTGQTLVYNSATDLWVNNTVSLTAGVNGTLPILNGGTGQTTANAAFNALAPSQTGNSGKYLTTDGTDTSWASNPLGTVTSVAASVPSFLSIAGSPITTSGTLAISLSGTALPTTSGGTGLTSFTSGGVVYASSTSALATGSALTFDGSTFQVTGRIAVSGTNPSIRQTVQNAYLDLCGGTVVGTDPSIQLAGSTLSNGDANTVFYNTNTHIFRTSAGSSEYMRLNGTGLGIGTDNPAYKLDVAGGHSRIRSAYAQFWFNSDNTNFVGIYNGGSSGASTGQMFFETNGTEQLRITSSGNILKKYGTEYQSYTSGGSVSHMMSYQTWGGQGNLLVVGNTFDGIVFGTGGGTMTEKGRFTASGELLIGTNNNTAYGGKLVSVAGATQPSLVLDVESGTNTSINWHNAGTAKWTTQVLTTGEFRFYNFTNNQERLRITEGGNVGIGTNNPATLLDVTRAYGANFVATFQNTTSATPYCVQIKDAASPTAGYPLLTITDSTGVTSYFRVDSSNGNVGIGASPNAYKLNVRTAPATTALDGSYVSDGTRIVIVGQSGATYNYAGIAANENLIYSSANPLNIVADGQPIKFSTGNERMRITTAGDVGIGTNNPQFRLSVAGGQAQFVNGSSFYINPNASEVSLYGESNVPLTIYTNTQPRMTLDTSGRMLVGLQSTSLSAKVVIQKDNGSPDAIAINQDSGGAGISFYGSATTAIFNYFVTSAGNCGQISGNGVVTSYTSVSDYRLKNTIAPMTGALAKVALLKPCTYKWNSNGSDGQGFIAHELAEVCPQAVTGEKDAVDENNNPKYQGIDTSFLVATLTAAIQEQQAIIESLKARLDAANL